MPIRQQDSCSERQKMNGTQKLPVGEHFWNPAGQSVRNSLTRTQSSCQEMTFQRLLTWPSEALDSPSESFFYWTGLQPGQAVFSACFPAAELGGSKGLSSFSLLSFSPSWPGYRWYIFLNFESSVSLTLRHHLWCVSDLNKGFYIYTLGLIFRLCSRFNLHSEGI